MGLTKILAVQRNATHGQQLTQDEKKSYALKWWGVLNTDDIKKALSVSERTFEYWTKNRRDEHEAQILKQIHEMYMRCESQKTIAKEIEFSESRISEIIAEKFDKRKIADSEVFPRF